MNIANKILSVYTADVFGACNALYELGGLLVIHDASGCNSTYTTHDEPRWGKLNSQIFISALTEIDAISGNDKKLIDDVVNVAKDLKPEFIVILTTPIPVMTGFDYDGVSNIIEQKTKIKTFSIETTGMRDYIDGIKDAYKLIFEKFINENCDLSFKNNNTNIKKLIDINDINLIGLTTLDFYYGLEEEKIFEFFQNKSINVLANISLNTNLTRIKNSYKAEYNIIVAESGIDLAKKFYELFNIPYCVAYPINNELIDVTNEFNDFNNVRNNIEDSYKKILINDNNEIVVLNNDNYQKVSNKYFIIGEIVKCLVLKKYIKKILNVDINILYRCSEDMLINILKDASFVIADGLYKPLCKDTCYFINYPHPAFSGRLYDEIKKSINDIFLEVKKNEKIFI